MAFKSPSASSSSIILVNDVGTTGITNYLFTIPSDCESIVAKFWTGAVFSGTGPSATVYIQTSEDGGTTWRDVVQFNTTTNVPNANAHFAPIGFISNTDRGILNYVGSVAASTLTAPSVAGSAVGITSGMVMMGTLGRISVQYAGTVSTNNGIMCQIFAPTGLIR